MAKRRKEAAPHEELAALAARLADGEPERGYLLRGDERYFHDRATDLLRGRAAELGFDVCVHDGSRGNPDFSLAALIDDLSGGGLFAGRRLVVVRRPEEHLKKVDGDASPLTRVARSFLSSADSPGTLVLSAPSLRLDHPLAKAVVAAGGSVLALRRLWDSPPPWAPDPTRTELVQWLLGRARELGLRLEPAQAVYVCAAVGNDLAALDDQLAELRSSGGRSLRDVVSWTAATTPWAVADPIVAGDLPRALTGIEGLFRGGFQEQGGRRLLDSVALSTMLTAALGRGVRQALRLATELQGGRSEADAASAAGLRGRPQTVQGIVRRAQSRPVGVWRRMLGELVALERRAKSGVGVDANDFAALALRWSARPEQDGRSGGAGRPGRRGAAAAGR